MNNYFFVLGNAYALCKAELITVLKQQSISYSILETYPPVFVISTDATPNLQSLINRLGGTVKIGVCLKTAADAKVAIVDDLTQDVTCDTIGFSSYSVKSFSVTQLLSEIKSTLAQTGRKIRYVLPKNKTDLQSIVIQKQKVTEYVLLGQKEQYLGKTVVVQDSEAWGKRDFGRPAANAAAGMLPIKVARMMINIAAPQGKILDPFCGMGTIVSEAATLGYGAIGSDLHEEAVAGAKKNFDWLAKNYTDLGSAEFLVANAVDIDKKLAPGSIGAIITEPFMGAPFELRGGVLFQKNVRATVDSVKNTIKGLEKLYLGCLKSWYPLLAKNGKIVMAIPMIHFAGRDYFVKKVVDNCEKLGYTIDAGPLEYSRPQAVVKRTIFVFSKITS